MGLKALGWLGWTECAAPHTGEGRSQCCLNFIKENTPVGKGAVHQFTILMCIIRVFSTCVICGRVKDYNKYIFVCLLIGGVKTKTGRCHPR